MMLAKRNLPLLAIVAIDYDLNVDYATAPDNVYVLLRSVSQGDTITPNDLIQYGMIYHVDTSTYQVGDRLPQGWVKRSHQTNGIISVDLAPVVRTIDLQYQGDPITLSPAAYTINSVFVDIDIWSVDQEYEISLTNGLITTLIPTIPIGQGARLRIQYLSVC